MNDFDRNIRTLIVCFVVLVFALIPLRFIEAGEQISVPIDAQVLGETVVVNSTTEKTVIENQAKLEAPYDELEN